jgi:hypothetical protein
LLTPKVDKVSFTCQKNTTDEEMAENILANVKRGLPYLKVKRAAIVGGGPSVVNHFEDIRRDQLDGFKVFALNGAAHLLHKNGITPDYQVCYDPRPDNLTFIRPKVAKKYLVVSHAHPSILDELADQEVHLFHAMAGNKVGEQILSLDPHAHILGPGMTVGLQMLNLLVMRGFRDCNFYGYDSSSEGAQHHAYSQPLNDKNEQFTFQFEDVEYTADAAMAAQAQEFMRHAPEYEKFGLVISVIGKGLLPHMWKSYRSRQKGIVFGKTLEESEAEKYERMWRNPDYRKVAPGEHFVDFFQIACKPGKDDFVIDFGCGTGRAAKALRTAGFRVLGVDFAPNCLDRDADIDFAIYNLWDLPEDMRCDWGYCCDVMEHIPTDKVDGVLKNIAQSCRKGCFFNISMEPDSFSVGSSDKLHLTVMPVEWWITMLEKHFGDTIHYIYDSGIFMSIK